MEKECKRLSAREIEALEWAGRGQTSIEIGAIMKISHRTVEEHLANVRHKLGAHSTTEASMIWVKRLGSQNTDSSRPLVTRLRT